MTGRQVLAVVEGNAVVSGADGVEQRLSAGEAAIRAIGEMHGTRSVNGLTRFVIEGHLTVIT